LGDSPDHDYYRLMKQNLCLVHWNDGDIHESHGPFVSVRLSSQCHRNDQQSSYHSSGAAKLAPGRTTIWPWFISSTRSSLGERQPRLYKRLALGDSRAFFDRQDLISPDVF
jgi:hypothetical protein